MQVERCDLRGAHGTPEYDRATVIPPGARAYRIKTVAPRVAVHVPEPLRDKVARSTFLRLAEPGETAPLAVRADACGALSVHDSYGRLHAPRAPEPAALQVILDDLSRCARATVLRTVRESSPGHPGVPATVEWGLVRGGRPHPLPLTGQAVDVGEPIYVKVRNDSRHHDLFVSLVDIGVAYSITVLTHFARGGVPLRPGEKYVFGTDFRDGTLNGERLLWPQALSRATPRPETVLVFITSEHHDISILEQSSAGVRAATRNRSPLDQMLVHLGAGVARDLLSADGFFGVESVEFDLVP
jgi:hypothetical protein